MLIPYVLVHLEANNTPGNKVGPGIDPADQPTQQARCEEVTEMG